VPLISRSSVLLLIDLQRGLFGPSHSVLDGEAIVARARSLLCLARVSGAKVIFVQDDHGPGLWPPDEPGWDLHETLTPREGETQIRKTFGDAFRGTELDGTLLRLGCGELIVAGCMTDFSVRATLERALLKVIPVTLVGDCRSTLDAPDGAAAFHVDLLNREVARAEQRGLPIRLRNTSELG
jgi:nicotinamidase-related amidase